MALKTKCVCVCVCVCVRACVRACCIGFESLTWNFYVKSKMKFIECVNLAWSIECGV